jgi:hypothetical protein
MRKAPRLRRGSWLERAARVAFAFVVLNASAVEALLVVLFKRKVWRR